MKITCEVPLLLAKLRILHFDIWTNVGLTSVQMWSKDIRFGQMSDRLSSKSGLKIYDLDKCRVDFRPKVLRVDYHTKEKLHNTFITINGLQQNMYSNMIQSQVVLDDLFKNEE